MEEKMTKSIFVDGLMEIRVTGGAIRLDLARYSDVTKDNKQNPILEKSDVSLVMTPEGFAHFFNGMERVASSLAEAGVLKRHGPAAGSTRDDTASLVSDDTDMDKSVNIKK